MRVGGTADQGVVVTLGTVCCSHLHQRSVVRRSDAVGIRPGINMTGGTVTWCRLASGQTDQGTGSTIVACGTGDVRLNANQGVIVTGRTGGAANSDDHAMIRSGGVDSFPSIDMTGLAITDICKSFIRYGSTTNQATERIVTAAACIVDLAISIIGQRRRSTMAVCTISRPYLNQRGVVRRVADMGQLPGVGMAGGTITTASRQTRLQSRNSSVTEGTVAIMNVQHGFSWSMTIRTVSRTEGNVCKCLMANVAVSTSLGRVTGQTVSRVGTGGNSVNNFCTDTAVAGCADAKVLSDNIAEARQVVPAVIVTDNTGSAIRQIARSKFNGMVVGCMT